MKLEYLADGSPECPLIRLYDFSSSEAEQLRTAVDGLATGQKQYVDVHALPFVQSIGACRLSFVCCSWDRAIVQYEPSGFECRMTQGTWDNIGMLITPFAEAAAGFQWLVDSPGKVSLLLSTDGLW